MASEYDRPRDCIACKGVCCNHVALSIEKPTCKRDYDNIRWYLMHENIHVFVDHDGDWLLQFLTPCKNLDRTYRCRIYPQRPKLCRDYPPDDKPCEYEVKEPVHQLLFTTAEEFEKWLVKKRIDWKYKKLPH